jgi:hypothetical protein
MLSYAVEDAAVQSLAWVSLQSMAVPSLISTASTEIRKATQSSSLVKARIAERYDTGRLGRYLKGKEKNAVKKGKLLLWYPKI